MFCLCCSAQNRILRIPNFLLDSNAWGEDIENRFSVWERGRAYVPRAGSHEDLGTGRGFFMDKTDLEYDIALTVIVMLSLVIAYLAQIVSVTT